MRGTRLLDGRLELLPGDVHVSETVVQVLERVLAVVAADEGDALVTGDVAVADFLGGVAGKSSATPLRGCAYCLRPKN